MCRAPPRPLLLWGGPWPSPLVVSCPARRGSSETGLLPARIATLGWTVTPRRRPTARAPRRSGFVPISPRRCRGTSMAVYGCPRHRSCGMVLTRASTVGPQRQQRRLRPRRRRKRVGGTLLPAEQSWLAALPHRVASWSSAPACSFLTLAPPPTLTSSLWWAAVTFVGWAPLLSTPASIPASSCLRAGSAAALPRRFRRARSSTPFGTSKTASPLAGWPFLLPIRRCSCLSHHRQRGAGGCVR